MSATVSASLSLRHLRGFPCVVPSLLFSSYSSVSFPLYSPRLCLFLRRRQLFLNRPHAASFSSSPGSKTSGPSYDVIVVGGGHAGCEAALASARLGATTLLLTLNLDRIAWQPCNPAVGGPAKSQLVHEVDALGGDIGKVADRCYLQKRILNVSRGPAVRSLRAQTDKREYAMEMKKIVESTENLCIREAMVTDILVGKNDNVEGVATFFGMNFYAPSVILTTGTFMSGKIWVGRKSMPAGRAGESASQGLTENLQLLGFETDRLKTGTPARVDRRTIDFSNLEAQHGDEEVSMYNYKNRLFRIYCMVTWVKVIHSASSLLGSMQIIFTTFLARSVQANSLALYKYSSHNGKRFHIFIWYLAKAIHEPFVFEDAKH